MSRPGALRASFIAVVALFATVRLAVICAVMNITTAGPADQAIFIEDAHMIASTGRTNDYYYGPLYPGCLAMVLKFQQAFGLESLPLRLTAGVLQTLLYTAAIAVFGWMIYRRYSPIAGVSTVLIVGLWLNQVLVSGVLMTERLSTPLFVLGLTTLLWRRRPTWRLLALTGFAFGLMCLTRPALFPVVGTSAVIAAWLVGPNWKRRLGAFCLITVFAGSMQLPWVGYIWHRTGRVNTGSTAGGLNYCLGNNPYTTAYWQDKSYAWCNEGMPANQFDQSNAQYHKGLRWAIGHLSQQPRLVRVRWELIMGKDADSLYGYPYGDDYRGPSNVATLSGWFNRWWEDMKQLSVVSLFFGLIVPRWRRLYAITLALAASQLLIPLVSVGDSRYHDAIVPLMALWVGGLIAMAVDGVRAIIADQREYRAELTEEASKEGEVAE